MTDRIIGQSFMALQLSCRGNPMRERILRDWVSFAESRNELHLLQTLPKTPKGAMIDWIRLYEEVVARGGFVHVSQHKLWSQIVARDCLNLDAMPYVIATFYQRYLFAFEEKQLFGRDMSTTGEPSTGGEKRKLEDMEKIATASELQEAQSVRGTPVPPATKKLRAQRTLHSDLGSLQALVLALDSQNPDEVHRAISLLSVLSYGNPQQLGDNDLLIDNIPGLLDALYRQLQTCKLLPYEQLMEGAREPLRATQAMRSRFLNLSNDVGQRELLDTKGLLLLNIVRNLSMIGENELPLAQHEDTCVLLILLLRSLLVAQSPTCVTTSLRRRTTAREIGDHALDILCYISKRIDFRSLNPPLKVVEIKLRPAEDRPLATTMWEKEKLTPLECVLQQLSALLRDVSTRRTVVLRVCELMCNVCRDVSLRHALSQSPTMQDPELLDRLTHLLASTRGDFARRKRYVAGGHDAMPEADDDDDMDDESDDEQDCDDGAKWPAPWENDGYPSGVGMGVVYTSADGHGNNRSNAMLPVDDEPKLDHEMRDAALEVLHRLSDCDDSAKLRLAKHPTCLTRLATLLTSCIGRPEAPRIAVATLSNISMNRDTFPYFLPIEKDLILVACSDRSVADILNNVVADVFGMHSL
ncbi:TPA: hypothetical protein N0F65_009268 [Lagenidium giganteum]|uniref:ARID domain-containing protein n=1 Tax=Lagenidium giganteum TaxID=4803 RepID=A0AAV2YRY0_9STRA|nr:TPA: hypothetical protein N0F65_009268 [Lagenidium giganteum]